MFSKYFKKRKLKKLKATLRKTHPELFDETGNTYNAGNFEPSTDAIILGQSDLELFLDVEVVFDDPSDTEKNFMLPLCRFNLKIINPAWDGVAYFIYYQKSQSKNIQAEFYLNEYGDYNVTIFKTTMGKLKYSGFPEVFQYDENEKRFWEEAETDYNISQKLYVKNPENFFSEKELVPGSIIKQIWSTPKWIQNDETPKPFSNEKIYFIGQLNVNTLISYAGGWIFLFYCPENNCFIQIEQWT
jgi:hypothetical protein